METATTIAAAVIESAIPCKRLALSTSSKRLRCAGSSTASVSSPCNTRPSRPRSRLRPTCGRCCDGGSDDDNSGSDIEFDFDDTDVGSDDMPGELDAGRDMPAADMDNQGGSDAGPVDLPEASDLGNDWGDDIA